MAGQHKGGLMRIFILQLLKIALPPTGQFYPHQTRYATWEKKAREDER